MPLTGAVKNQITGQIDTVFDAIEAGTAFENPEWIHTSFGFTAGGNQYVVTVIPEGSYADAEVVVRIKRTPL